MVETPSTIEQDIAELERKLEEKRAVLGQEKPEKEVFHEVVGEKIKEHVPGYSPISKQSGLATQSPIQAIEPPSYLTQELKDRIQELVQLVFNKNLEEGIKKAAVAPTAAFRSF